MTASIQVGDRVKFTNNSTTFYGIVTAIASGTITIYGGTQYTVANSAITNPYFSHSKNPFGFNSRPDYWTEVVTDSSQQSQSSPGSGTWYNIGTISIAVPIGAWRLYWSALCQIINGAVGATNLFTGTLSTANNSQSDSDLSAGVSQSGATAPSSIDVRSNLSKEKTIVVASKTSYYLNGQSNGAGDSSIQFRGDFVPTKIYAICAYL